MVYLILAYGSIWLLWMPLHFAAKARGSRVLSTVFKVIPTLLAATLAGGSALLSPEADAAAWLLFAGLMLGAAADAALDTRITVGGTIFFAAHLCYIAAFLTLSAPDGWFALVTALSFSLGIGFLSRYRAQFGDPRLRVGVTLYLLALCLLLGAALPTPVRVGTLRGWLGAVGALLFVLSDAALCRNSVAHRMARAQEAAVGYTRPGAARRRTVENALSLGCYYTAQMALALCAALAV